MRVWEKLNECKCEIREFRQSVNKLKEEKINLNEELQLLKIEKEKSDLIKDSQINHINDKNTKLEIDNKMLIDQNKQISEKLTNATPKITKYDELLSTHHSLKHDYDKMVENTNTHLNLILSVKKEKEEILSKLDFNKLELENLKNDKFYLSRENMTLSEKLKYAEDKVILS